MVGALAAASFVLALRIGGRPSPRARNGLALLAVALLGLCLFLLHHPVFLVRMLPVPNLIVLGNWIPFPCAFLAGLAWHMTPRAAWRKVLSVVALLAVCAYAVLHPLLQARVQGGDLWRGGVCLQSSPASCSAACAATLLRTHGIPAGEEEMVRVCLTNETGTLFYGLYRGLRLKTAGTPWRVEVLSGRLSDVQAQWTGPAILTVGLRTGVSADPRYERDWGWLPGVRHAVVVFRFLPNGRVEIGDPAIGRETWPVETLRDLWYGEGLRLVQP